MSRYTIDKLLWEIDRSDDAVAAFVADTGAFLARWEAAEPLPPHPEGGSLTPEERTAFEEWDYATLYRLGAHPYLLWHVVRAVYVPSRMTHDELVEDYRRVIGPLGNPDFVT